MNWSGDEALKHPLGSTIRALKGQRIWQRSRKDVLYLEAIRWLPDGPWATGRREHSPWVRTRTGGSLDKWKAYREWHKLSTAELLEVWDAALIFCLTSKLCPKAQTWNRLWRGISPSQGEGQSPPAHIHQDPKGNYCTSDVAPFNESQMAAPPRANNSSWDSFASLIPLGCIKCVFALLPEHQKRLDCFPLYCESLKLGHAISSIFFACRNWRHTMIFPPYASSRHYCMCQHYYNGKFCPTCRCFLVATWSTTVRKKRISQGMLSAGSDLHCSWCSDASILQFLMGKNKLKKDCKGWGSISGPLKL